MKDLKNLEKLLKAVANHRRVAILKHLKREGRASVSNIMGAIDLSFNATSKHLKVLYSADILDREQISSRMFYWLADEQHSIIKNLLAILSL